MLAYANDFWPLFWTLFGAGVLLSVLLSAALGLTRRPPAAQAAVQPVTTGTFGADRDREVRAAA